MIVILIGAPGSGKGTQSRVLSGRYGLTHLATGDIFRAEIAAKSSLGEKAASYVKSGKLVPDDLVTEMVAGKMDLKEGKYLLDGFPRTLAQAQSLDQTLSKNKAYIDLVAYLNLPQAQAIKRLSSRRVCASCGEVYNVITRPPTAEGKCDKCQGKVEQREDDCETTVAKRLQVFEDLTSPLIAYYKAEQIFHEVDAAGSAEQVAQSLCAAIDGLHSKAGDPASMVLDGAVPAIAKGGGGA